MYLFLDSVSSEGYIALYDSNKQVLAKKNFLIAGNESTKLLQIITAFMKEQSCGYDDLVGIYCIHGPGSFTGVRTICLMVNTIAYTYPHIDLYPVTFFDVFSNYPVVKRSSKHDFFVKSEKNAIIEVYKQSDIEQIYSQQNIYGDVGMYGLNNVEVTFQPYYDKYIQTKQVKGVKTIDPLYIKKPNIS